MCAPGEVLGAYPLAACDFALVNKLGLGCRFIFTFANLARRLRCLVLRRRHLVVVVAAAGARVLSARDLRRTCRYYVDIRGLDARGG
jgi:hypothetical protein